MATGTGRRPGRPSKGPRHRVNLRMPETIAHEAVARAKELGLTLNDYVNLLLAEDIRPGSTARQEGIDTAA